MLPVLKLQSGAFVRVCADPGTGEAAGLVRASSREVAEVTQEPGEADDSRQVHGKRVAVSLLHVRLRLRPRGAVG